MDGRREPIKINDMSTMTLRKAAELCRDSVDNARVGENKLDIRWYEENIMSYRNFLKDRETKNAGVEMRRIDAAWYTARVIEITFDNDTEMFAFTLPNGRTSSVGDDMDIIIKPIAGAYNPFIRIPDGWFGSDLSFAEGNVIWQAGVGDRIEFPGMLSLPGNGKVRVEVIESGTPDNSMQSINMPSDYVTVCMDAIFKKAMAAHGEDTRTTWKEDAPQ